MSDHEQGFWKDAELKGRSAQARDYKTRLALSLAELKTERERVRVLREALGELVYIIDEESPWRTWDDKKVSAFDAAREALAALSLMGGEEIMESQTAVPGWKDPYTNNGDRRPDTDYRHGWNDCRVAMLAAAKEQGHENA